MKVSVDIDCTPEEARRFMGLPDLGPLHDAYLEKMKRTIDEGVTPEMMQNALRAWSPMGEAGLGMWKQIFDQVGAMGRG